MLAWLAAATPEAPESLVTWAKAASQIGFVAGVIILCLALYRRLLVPFTWVLDLRAQMETMRTDYEARLVVKDALIDKKDDQLAAAMRTIVDDTVPAIVRSQLQMERLEAELRARRER